MTEDCTGATYCPECDSIHCPGPGTEVDPETNLPDELCPQAREMIRKTEDAGMGS